MKRRIFLSYQWKKNRPNVTTSLIQALVIVISTSHILSCESKGNPPPSPSPKISQPTRSQDTSSSDETEQDEGIKTPTPSIGSKATSSRSSGSSSSKNSANSKEKDESTKGTYLDPNLVQAACIAPPIKGNAKKLVEFLNNPSAPGGDQVSAAERKSALEAIEAAKSTKDPEGLLTLQLELDRACKN